MVRQWLVNAGCDRIFLINNVTREGIDELMEYLGEDLPRMTLAEANRLTVVGALIQDTVVRANRYLDALKDRRYVEETNILDEEAFTHLVNAFFQARDRGLTECSMIRVAGVGENNKQEAARALSAQIRQTDYLGMMRGNLYVLLSNTDQEGAGSVIERFQQKGYRSELKEVAA